MKKILFILSLLIGVVSCRGGSDSAVETSKTSGDYVEVIYFHGKKRCPTCRAIEQCSREVIDSTFAKDVKNGKVVFRTVDISTSEGEALADKYQITWSSLFVNRWSGGKETRSDMTEYAFSNARKDPAKFKQTLTDKIRQSLK